MKTWKVTLVSVILSLCTLGMLNAQSAPKLAFSVNSGIAQNGLPIQVGFRVGLGNHLNLNGQIGTAPWKYKQRGSRHIEQNVTLKDLKIRGQEAYSFDLRAYTSPGQRGFYGGAGLQWQNVSIESKTRLTRPSSGGFSTGATSVGGLLFQGFFGLIDNLTRNQNINQTENLTVRAVVFDAGYAHVFENNQRLEFGVRLQNRDLSRAQYNIPTFDEPRFFDVEQVINPITVGAELRYVIPLY